MITPRQDQSSPTFDHHGGNDTMDEKKSTKKIRVKTPNDNDVLFGRGGRNNKHSGNEKLRLAAKERCSRYMVSEKKEKSHIAIELVQYVRNLDPPGRFLERAKDGDWEDVGNTRAREKTSQAMRDAVALFRRGVRRQKGLPRVKARGQGGASKEPSSTNAQGTTYESNDEEPAEQEGRDVSRYQLGRKRVAIQEPREARRPNPYHEAFAYRERQHERDQIDHRSRHGRPILNSDHDEEGCPFHYQQQYGHPYPDQYHLFDAASHDYEYGYDRVRTMERRRATGTLEFHLTTESSISPDSGPHWPTVTPVASTSPDGTGAVAASANGAPFAESSAYGAGHGQSRSRTPIFDVDQRIQMPSYLPVTPLSSSRFKRQRHYEKLLHQSGGYHSIGELRGGSYGSRRRTVDSDMATYTIGDTSIRTPDQRDGGVEVPHLLHHPGTTPITAGAAAQPGRGWMSGTANPKRPPAEDTTDDAPTMQPQRGHAPARTATAVASPATSEHELLNDAILSDSEGDGSRNHSSSLAAAQYQPPFENQAFADGM